MKKLWLINTRATRQEEYVYREDYLDLCNSLDMCINSALDLVLSTLYACNEQVDLTHLLVHHCGHT